MGCPSLESVLLAHPTEAQHRSNDLVRPRPAAAVMKKSYYKQLLGVHCPLWAGNDSLAPEKDEFLMHVQMSV